MGVRPFLFGWSFFFTFVSPPWPLVCHICVTIVTPFLTHLWHLSKGYKPLGNCLEAPLCCINSTTPSDIILSKALRKCQKEGTTFGRHFWTLFIALNLWALVGGGLVVSNSANSDIWSLRSRDKNWCPEINDLKNCQSFEQLLALCLCSIGLLG